MEAKDLSLYTDMVFEMAMKKCGNTNDARDLSQDAMLCALKALRKGNTVEKPEKWLSAIVNNCFNRSLRYKYKYQTMSIDEFDIAYEENNFENILKKSEMEEIRRQIAYLSKLYRDVFVKFYMQGKSISDISKELKIPKGTVLSRLDAGRKHIKKEVEKMQNYGSRSFNPGNLFISVSGHTGLNKEPFSLVNSLLVKNVLLAAYKKPVNEKEIAGELGISLPYIEEAVDTLVKGELMCRKGEKVYTNFIIYTVEDSLKGLNKQKNIASKSFDIAWPIYLKYAEKINSMNCFNSFNTIQKILLTILELTPCAISELCLKEIGDKYINFDEYPERPNEGRWYITGYAYPDDYKNKYPELIEYSLNGGLSTRINNYNGHDYIMLVDFDTFIGKTHGYYQSLKYSIDQGDVAKILYAIKYDKPPLEEWKMELIPEFKKIGIVNVENGKTNLTIPVITYKEYSQFEKFMSEGEKELAQALENTIINYFKEPKTKYPKYIDTPIQFSMTEFTNYLPMAYVYTAIDKEKLKLEESKKYPVMYMIIK